MGAVVCSIITSLSSAFFEWVLILMLFIDGVFGYLITKFARYCQLPIPCLFCSRLDHVLGKQRRGFCWDLICCNHKLNISTLVLCPLHNNLSFQTVNKSDTEMNRSNTEIRVLDEDPVLDDPRLSSSSNRNCFCCKEKCVSNGFAQNLLQIKSVGSDAAKYDSPSPVKNIDNTFHAAKTILSQVSSADSDNMLKGINFRQAECDIDISVPSESKSLSEVLPSSNATGAQNNVTTESLTTDLEKEMPKVGNNSVAPSETLLDSKADKTNTSAQMTVYLDLGDAYKLATGSRVRQLSGKFLKQMSLKDSTQNSEGLMILLSQLSATRGIESSLNSDDFKGSLDRNESNISLDGSIVSEIEGESLVDRLKRQVEHDKRLMSSLYKELEEERSASAVAANQAMAMITRLQEEKAAVQIEALQWLRMMEEQAEFDAEALEKANEIILEMQKVIQNLEAELELYKNKYNDITLLKGHGGNL